MMKMIIYFPLMTKATTNFIRNEHGRIRIIVMPIGFLQYKCVLQYLVKDGSCFLENDENHFALIQTHTTNCAQLK